MKLTCGLEVHAQLLSPHKLFSGTSVAFNVKPNSRVSFYDAALPGTHPKLNWDCLRLGLRAAVALNAKVQPRTSFDRKHYMYPDQPTGYQITQNFEPYARNGYLELQARDFRKPSDPLKVRIKQLQLEQDTGKTIYSGDVSNVDLNRMNTALIELVTEPDITSPEAAAAFVRKLQTLLRHLQVCSGDMETGAMRVDANVSVDGGRRCEIKNLFSPSAVRAAVAAEFRRQCKMIQEGRQIVSETRGWDGKHTTRLRVKDASVDYRYMPDPEIPEICIPAATVDAVAKALPSLPDEILDSMIDTHPISTVDARTLFELGMSYVEFYQQVYRDFVVRGGSNGALVANWLVHRWLGETDVLPPIGVLTELLLFIDAKKITMASGKLVSKHLAGLVSQGQAVSPAMIETIVQEYGLAPISPSETGTAGYAEICSQVVAANPDVVNRIRAGKKGSIAFLLGQVMKDTQGTVDPALVRKELESLIGSF